MMLLEACGKKIVIDCGMEQGINVFENVELPVAPGEVDYVFLTHAHIDHSGHIPLLVKRGFKGEIHATDDTMDLCGIMLRDSAHIQEFEAEWRNRKNRRAGKPEILPLYDMNDVFGVLGHFEACDYDSQIEICEGLSVRFIDAGHLLGSSSIEMWITEDDVTKKIVFSGDIGTGNRPLIKDPEYIEDADYVPEEEHECHCGEHEHGHGCSCGHHDCNH